MFLGWGQTAVDIDRREAHSIHTHIADPNLYTIRAHTGHLTTSTVRPELYFHRGVLSADMCFVSLFRRMVSILWEALLPISGASIP
jgi:hypothetical protein